MVSNSILPSYQVFGLVSYSLNSTLITTSNTTYTNSTSGVSDIQSSVNNLLNSYVKYYVSNNISNNTLQINEEYFTAQIYSIDDYNSKCLEFSINNLLTFVNLTNCINHYKLKY